ncbi:hypothetical protein J6590_024272 [Homalodisca vitripennis]|nr:hypothetical protein J6590_024272 [Homalodisca vitripennis]
MSSKITSSSHYENNLHFVFDLRSIGKGQASDKTLCSVMNMPPISTVQFVKMKKDHDNCLANYEGTSGGIEAAVVLQIFQRSDKRNIPVRLPKTTFVNGLTVKLGVLDAVLCYNEGALGKVSVFEDLCGEAGPNCVLGLKKKDARRVKGAERAFEELKKKARKAKRNIKRRLKDEEMNDANPEYGAGLF